MKNLKHSQVNVKLPVWDIRFLMRWMGMFPGTLIDQRSGRVVSTITMQGKLRRALPKGERE